MDPSLQDALTLALAGYGAVLSSVLASQQLRRDRRRLKIMASTLISAGPGPDVNVQRVLEVRAINEGHRPVKVRQAAVITQDGTSFHPMLAEVRPHENKAPCTLGDGDSVSFYFSAQSFDGPRWIPKAVYVQDYADKKYVLQLSRDEQEKIASLAKEAIEATETSENADNE